MAWCRTGDNPLSEQMMGTLLMCIQSIIQSNANLSPKRRFRAQFNEEYLSFDIFIWDDASTYFPLLSSVICVYHGGSHVNRTRVFYKNTKTGPKLYHTKNHDVQSRIVTNILFCTISLELFWRLNNLKAWTILYIYVALVTEILWSWY